MTRPTYENEQTLEAEERVAKALGALWGMTVTKRPGQPKLDFEVKDGDKVVAYLELKQRGPSYTVEKMKQLGSAFISEKKMIAGRKAFEAGFHFIIVFSLPDGLLYWSSKWVTKFPDFQIKQSGRFDRGDPADCEPCAHIPFHMLKVIQ